MFETMGLALMRLGRCEEALEVFRKQLALGRNKASAWANIGVCLGCLGQTNEAIEALNEAILMRPNDEVCVWS
jgi:Flp pilus assembly protein TadD